MGMERENNSHSRIIDETVIFSAGLLLMSIYVVRTVLPFLASDLGGSKIDVSRILYVSFVVIAVLSPLAGLISDRIGASRLLLVSSASASLSILMYPLASNVDQLLAVRIVHSIFTELALAAGLSIAGSVTSSGGVGVGLLRASQGMGIALGPMIALALVPLGYSFTFLAASLLSLTPLLAFLRKEEVRSISLGDSMNLFSNVIRTRELQVLLFIAISEVLGFSILVTYFVAHMISLGLNEEGYAIFLTIEALSFSLAGYPSERLFRRFSLRFAIMSGLGLGASFLILALFPSPFVFMAMAPAIGILSSFSYNPAYIYASDLAEEGARGFIVNSLDLMINLAFLSLPLLEPLFTNLSPSSLMIAPLIPLGIAIFLMVK